MDGQEISQLKGYFKKYPMVFWAPDHTKCFRVTSIGCHAEEGDDEPCAIFGYDQNKYIALYNVKLSDFIVGLRAA